MSELAAIAARVRTRLDGRTVWNVNSTATGGGVAEMLAQLVGYGIGSCLRTRADADINKYRFDLGAIEDIACSDAGM